MFPNNRAQCLKVKVLNQVRLQPLPQALRDEGVEKVYVLNAWWLLIEGLAVVAVLPCLGVHDVIKSLFVVLEIKENSCLVSALKVDVVTPLVPPLEVYQVALRLLLDQRTSHQLLDNLLLLLRTESFAVGAAKGLLVLGESSHIDGVEGWQTLALRSFESHQSLV